MIKYFICLVLLFMFKLIVFGLPVKVLMSLSCLWLYLKFRVHVDFICC